jgi:uncharacterized Zn-binding protein involved in type VI secretion
MPPAARISDPTAHGAPLAPGPGSVNVIIGGMPAWRAMIDQHACPAVSITGPDGIGSVMVGSPTVMINNMMACRMGDIVIEKPGLALGPANPIVMGCPTVIIGDVGMGGAFSPFAGAMAAAKASAAAYCQPEPPQQVLGDEIPSQSGDPSSKKKLEWIGIQLVNELGVPYATDELHGLTTDGDQHQTAISGGLHFTQIPGGTCTFNFPKFYDDMKNWKPNPED